MSILGAAGEFVEIFQVMRVNPQDRDDIPYQKRSHNHQSQRRRDKASIKIERSGRAYFTPSNPETLPLLHRPFPHRSDKEQQEERNDGKRMAITNVGRIVKDDG